MAAFLPFEPAVESGQAGLTQVIVLASNAVISNTIKIPTSVGSGNSALLVTMVNASVNAAMTAYVRMTTEASTAITATITDTPMFAPSGGSEVRLFASPNQAGAYNIAVIISISPALAGSAIYFTPGQGGVGT